MARCQVGLGPSIVSKLGLDNVRALGDDAKAFVDGLEKQLSAWFKAGATASTRTIPCATQHRLASLDDRLTTIESHEEFVKHPPTEAIIISSSPNSPTALSCSDHPEEFAGTSLENCCKFHGNVVPFGDVRFNLKLEIKTVQVTVKVEVKLGIKVGIASTDHKGVCAPPATCENESVAVDLLVVYNGLFVISAEKEFDLGPLGKISTGGSLTLEANFTDMVGCTLKCPTDL
jgi:hypothetical protein